MWRVIFHLIATINYVFSMWYDQNYVDLKSVSPVNDIKFFKGRLKYLTIWNMLLQATFFTVCTLNDVIGSNEDTISNKPLIRKLKDGLLTCLAFPLSMFVGITFWALYAVDRELVFPKALDEFFPSWLNHVMHTNIMIFILIELATSYRKYPSRKVGISVLSLFMLVYLVWVHIIHAYSGMWVYPVLEVLNLPLRILFFLSSLGLGVALYIFGEKLNSIIWSNQLQQESRTRKSQ
ncbi:hypothetical protein ILUMI_07453 [Ignelater luminosus]|uniref:Uncharacterized protein n=1 Tax=Ignelater luminosus TaxID=2038154 RepID=A0A8K0GEE1_IGNLU|nr:hypothetical protein ILUMI_07453 [Ignelater luminosus]